MRDYRPRVLTEMVKHDVIRITAEQRYYLREGHKLTGLDDGAAGLS
jgi:hypothetical protein